MKIIIIITNNKSTKEIEIWKNKLKSDIMESLRVVFSIINTLHTTN